MHRTKSGHENSRITVGAASAYGALEGFYASRNEATPRYRNPSRWILVIRLRMGLPDGRHHRCRRNVLACMKCGPSAGIRRENFPSYRDGLAAGRAKPGGRHAPSKMQPAKCLLHHFCANEIFSLACTPYLRTAVRRPKRGSAAIIRGSCGPSHASGKYPFAYCGPGRIMDRAPHLSLTLHLVSIGILQGDS